MCKQCFFTKRNYIHISRQQSSELNDVNRVYCAKAAEHARQPVRLGETSALILLCSALMLHACRHRCLPTTEQPRPAAPHKTVCYGTHKGSLRTSRQPAAGPCTRCWSHWNIYRGVFCCFCAEWLKSWGGGPLRRSTSPADSLSGLLVKRKSLE